MPDARQEQARATGDARPADDRPTYASLRLARLVRAVTEAESGGADVYRVGARPSTLNRAWRAANAATWRDEFPDMTPVLIES